MYLLPFSLLWTSLSCYPAISLRVRQALGSLLAVREFAGHRWSKHLSTNEINYFFRIKRCFLVHFASVDQIKASRLFAPLKVGERSCREKPIVVCRVFCYLTACKLKGRDGKTDLQLIISYSQKSCPTKEYGNRWQIEMIFKGMKKSVFIL